MSAIITTPRLTLRELTTADAPFMLNLLNSPSYIKYIGDRNVRTIEEAEVYLEGRAMQSYREFGYGMWSIIHRETHLPVGVCGLINRPGLEGIDIGFALLPEFEGNGIGFEAASAVLDYGFVNLDLARIIAIVDPENNASLRLLEKLGFHKESMVRLPGEEIDLVLLAKNRNH